MSFAARLVWGTILVIVAAIAIHVVGAEIALRGDLERDTRFNLEREARLVSRALPVDSLAWPTAVAQIARETGLRVTLIAPDGRVVAESDEAPESVPRIENHAARPEVREALAGRVGSDRRVSATVNRPLLYVAVPGGPGVVRVAATLSATDTILSHVHNAFFGAALVALLIGSGLAFVAGRSIARPLTTISQAARSIAQGAVPRFPRSGVPDIDELVRALRDMHQQLDERFADLRRERAGSAALVEAMVEGVIAADARGRIVTANGAARRLLGYEAEAALPALPQLFRAKAAREAVDAVLDGQRPPDRELELDGQSVLLTGRPLPHGGALLVLHDVTALRRLEMVRRDFVANVSHELKTPLTSISGYAETLVQDPPDGETMRRFLGVIHNNARRMQRLVDGLLDLSKIESGGWRPAAEPVEIGAVARESWGLLADRAEQRKITYQGSVGPDAGTVFSDPDAVRQVLSNLFDNAIRHTPAGGRITFSAARRDGGVQLEVRDTGAGIPADHLPRIFERFYRADPARARDDGGTGLGLAIVKHLVEAHGGEVAAESQLGRGTAIRCWFPDGPGIQS